MLLLASLSRLIDIENSLIGVPSLHRHHLVGSRRLHVSVLSQYTPHTLTPSHPHSQGHEAETVYCFGHLLYEMCTGTELKSAFLEPGWTLPAGVGE